jgi:exportin-1
VDYFDLQRAAAERVLRQLQEHPDTWTRVVAVLQNSQNLNSKFYALRVRIDYEVWNLPSKDQRWRCIH